MKKDETKLEVITYLEKASIVILGLLFLLFPVLFTNLTTDFFVLPKQALLIFVTLTLFILYGIKSILSEKISIRRTPFDVPILVFLLVLFLSSLFSVARIDSFVNYVPVLFAGLSFFAIVYNVKNEKSLLVLIGSLLGGGVILSLVSIFSYFKVYVFPFDFTKAQVFSPSGSILDQALYLAFILPLGLYFLTPFIFRKKGKELNFLKESPKMIGFGVASLIVLAGLGISIYSLMKLQTLVMLPLNVGFQTALSAISQDSSRAIQALIFGSGFGEFLTVFTRFKQASFNTSPLWTLTFVRSSSFILELLATTGLAGLISFLFIFYRLIKERPLFIPLLIALGASFVLPLSFYTLALIFFLLGIYSALRGVADNRNYFDVEIELVALKKGFFAFALEESTKSARGNTRALSYIVFALIIAISLFFGFLSYDYLSANITFEKSLVAASQNNGQQTYAYQNAALNTITGKYVDSYYRVFSQTNLALANALSASTPKGKQPDTQTTQTIYTLVQQSINAGRQATTLGPSNTLNWQNLAGIYRSLIGFGQNADSFAVLAQQQAVVLDPTNPQSYIALGGIYYQLKAWDNAQQQFQQAIALKPDFPNAYYNLGHVLQEKGDLKGALLQYQTVKQLIGNTNPDNLAKINQEIAAIEAQIGKAQTQTNATSGAKNETPLGVPTPSTVLPTQNPPVKIPGPSGTPTPTPTGAVNPSPTPTK